MKARATKSFNGLPDGATFVRAFNPGDLIVGELAEVAVSEGWAEETSDDDTDEPGDLAEPTPKPAARKGKKKQEGEGE